MVVGRGKNQFLRFLLRLVVVGKYTQTRKMLLRAKIVKSGHGRHYKKALAVYKKGDTSTTVLGI